jgi:glycerophosphoryl diester phosphodiesterase
MKLRHLILLIAACMALAPCMAQTTRCQTIAHRGEWRSEGSAQNSRTSLQRAMDLNIFGSEIDIWLTRDDHIMVNHDDKYQGASLQDASFAQCKRLRLGNGERMPQLKHLLRILKRSKSPTRLIVEVKPHRDPMRSRRCAAMAVNEIRRRGLEDRVMYISFSIEACLTIHAMAPEADVAYLEGDRTPASLHRMGINGIDYHFSKFQAHPEWVGEAHRLGMNVNVWTVDKPEDIRAMKALGVDYITTNEPSRCEELIR